MKQYRKLLSVISVLLMPLFMLAQGITTGSISGTVKNEKGESLSGAIIAAQHKPSGSKYYTVTQKDGSITIPNVKIGGPYQIIISYTGYATDTIQNAQVILGEELVLQVVLQIKATDLAVATVQGRRGTILTSNKNGSGTLINREAINNLPTISRSLSDFTRLTPQAGGSGLLGKGGKSNNLSIDGAAFNNSFGLGMETANIPGANANSQPISLDAIEQISVEVSPYSVKQGGFTGAGVNAVTRSGDNEFRGSVYYFFRNQDLVGKNVKSTTVPGTELSENTFGFRLGGPIIKNKLFFFGNYEEVENKQPGAAFLASRNGLTGSNISNVRAGTLDTVSNFLNTVYNYDPGSYENYDIPTESRKFLIKFDWNINEKHKASVRYNQLKSTSNFSATSSLNAIGFSNNGYKRSNDVYSITGEINSAFTSKAGNRLFASFTSLPDYRDYFGPLFPIVNINDNGKTYTFGTNNAARDNSVGQKILQIQDDISFALNNHKLSAGASYQYFNFSNSFTLNPQGSFTFNSLADFYNAAPAGTNTPVGVSTGLGLPSAFSLNYTVQPDRSATFVNPKMSQLGLYVQDDLFAAPSLKLTAGIRVDAISFIGDPVNNPAVAEMTFQNENGEPEKYTTETSPGTMVLVSPRFGFNWAVTENRSVQLRGGTGIFTGNNPFTYISASYAVNGLNEGSIVANGPAAANYRFKPAPAYYKPANGASSSTYEVDLVSKKFKLPQTWRSTLGLDWKLPESFVASLEAIYSKDINAPFYRNINLNSSTTTTGANGRLQYASNRINPTVTGAYLLSNINMGHQLFITASLNKQFSRNWFAMLSYTYGNSKDGFNFRSTTASGAFNAIPVTGNSNVPVTAYSEFDLRHRIVASGSYKVNYFNERMATSIGVYFEAAQQGRGSYTYAGTGDANRDGAPGNDLIFVPNDISQINLVASSTATIEQQWDALNTFINSSKYLSSRRGAFAERNGVLFPWYAQADLRIAQDFSMLLFKNNTKNTLQLTMDVLNFTNLVNKNWGVYKTMANATPVTALSATSFQVNPALLQQGEFIPDTKLSSTISPGASSRYRIQFGIRYIFN